MLRLFCNIKMPLKYRRANSDYSHASGISVNKNVCLVVGYQ